MLTGLGCNLVSVYSLTRMPTGLEAHLLPGKGVGCSHLSINKAVILKAEATMEKLLFLKREKQMDF